jgi:peptide/nickel transport system substrate-binding protein
MIALSPLLASTAANAQKQGGTLRIFHRDSPANMSIHEEGTISVVAPMMPIFNNLVLFNQHEKQNRLDNIVPDLADSWSWSEDGKDLTFKLHQGVNWHDGNPFTAADVKCTWDLLQGKAKERLRRNAREAWWANLDNVSVDNDYQTTFSLEAAAAGLSRLPRLRFHAGLSLPRLAGADAAASDRHGAIQICRIQAEPVD